MLPLSDGVPARRFPVVNVLLIAANFAVFLFYELPNLNSAVYHASFYPCTVDSACRAPEPWGVSRNIKDEIGLVFDVDPEDVTRLVKEAPDRHAVPLDDSHVVVRASGNTVTLIGHVRTPVQRDAVVAAAWRGHAVMAVINEVEITG